MSVVFPWSQHPAVRKKGRFSPDNAAVRGISDQSAWPCIDRAWRFFMD